MSYAMFERVVLTRDIAEDGLKAGDVGVIVVMAWFLVRFARVELELPLDGNEAGRADSALVDTGDQVAATKAAASAASLRNSSWNKVAGPVDLCDNRLMPSAAVASSPRLALSSAWENVNSRLVASR